MSGQYSKESRSEGWNGAQQTFRIVNLRLSPYVFAQDYSIDKRGETSLFTKIAGAKTWCRDKFDHQPVNEQQRNHDRDLRLYLRIEKYDRSQEVADCNPLQYARDPQLRKIEVGERIQEQTDPENDKGALDYL